jgi:alginate O-acetyltransferase complex protein AlgI
LRDYLYIPLGGNRRGPMRTYVNLMTVMVIGGLWHGASWTFVFWGGLHGLYLVVNHGFRSITGSRLPALTRMMSYRLASWLVTMCAVVIAWVFFRAQTFSGAGRVLGGMFLPDGNTSQVHRLLWNSGLQLETGAVACIVLAAIACVAPNSNRIGEAALHVCRRDDRICFSMMGAAVCIGAFLVLMNATRSSSSPFIYFNF